MRRLLLGIALGLAVVAVPTGGAAAVSPAVRMAIVHVVHGCHVWATADSRPLGPSRTLVLKRGARVEIRVNCPMSFEFAQVAGPKLALGGARWYPGTVRTLVFAKRGVYKLEGRNLETPESLGLETIGPDNVLVLTVRVR